MSEIFRKNISSLCFESDTVFPPDIVNTYPGKMKEFARKHIIALIFSTAGAIGGFLYWKFIGCSSGTCLIKSVWYLMTLYGILLGWVTGGLAEDIIVKFFKKQ